MEAAQAAPTSTTNLLNDSLGSDYTRSRHNTRKLVRLTKASYGNWAIPLLRAKR